MTGISRYPAPASVVASDTAPPSPSVGDLWYESDTGKTFIYYDSYWVEFVASTGPAGPTGNTGATGNTGPSGSWATTQTTYTPTFTANNCQLSASDLGKMLLLTNGANTGYVLVGTTLGFSAGQSIDMLATGTGQINVIASGATLNGTPGLKLRAQYSAATLFCVSANSYVLIGDLSA